MSETKHSDPTALGLFGLAMVTLVASSQKLDITTGTSYIIPWAMFLGGIAQLIAGALDYKKHNIFGATAFCAYGLFWLAVSLSWFIGLGVFGVEAKEAIDPHQLAFAYLGYLIFTLYMTIGSMETNKVLFIIFVLIDFLFLGLTLSTFGIAYETTHTMAAMAELFIAIVSFYGSAANLFINHFGKEILPIGKPFGIFK